MEVKVKLEVLEDIKKSLQNRNKSAVRIDLEGFGWGGPTFKVVLDEPKESDDEFVIDGVKFVADKDFGFIIDGLEIVKTGVTYAVAQDGGCC